MMISKNKQKYIASLELKKNRNSSGVFVAEGPKVVGDLLSLLDVEMIVATDSWLENNAAAIADKSVEIVHVSDDELRRVSFMQNPQQVLAVFRQRQEDVAAENVSDKLSLVLDGVQDPGNLGTILRVADWFGIDNVFCSHDTADVYNPKVVQATMGSIGRVNVRYTDLCKLFDALPKGFPVYGTLLNGDNMYDKELSNHGFIVMGNEGRGLSPEIRKRVTDRLYIPRFHDNRESAESLNVAVATAIVCSEFSRQQIKRHL